MSCALLIELCFSTEINMTPKNLSFAPSLHFRGTWDRCQYLGDAAGDECGVVTALPAGECGPRGNSSCGMIAIHTAAEMCWCWCKFGVADVADVMWLRMLLVCRFCLWRGAFGHLTLTCPEDGNGDRQRERLCGRLNSGRGKLSGRRGRRGDLRERDARGPVRIE